MSVEYRYTCSLFMPFFQETMRIYRKFFINFLYLTFILFFVTQGIKASSLEVPPIHRDLIVEEIALPKPAGKKAPAPKHIKIQHGGKVGQKVNIAAVVNDEIISTKDLEDRILLILGGKRIPTDSDDYKKLQSMIINQLIDERLQIQMAKRAGVNVTEQEVEEFYKNIEKQNNLPPGGLKIKLAKDRVPLGTFREKIWAQIAWHHLIGSSYKDVFRVSKMDMQDTIRKLSKKVPQYQLAEIITYVDTPEEEEGAQRKMNATVEALKKGTPFMVVAQQLSDAPSVLRGGDIGWIPEDQLDDLTVEILKKTSVNHTTPVIRTEDGYQILFLRDKINFDQMEEVLTARQLEVKIPEDVLSDPDKLENEKNRLEGLVSSINNCQDFDQLADQIEGATINIYKNVRLSEISPDLQLVMENLRVNEPSHGIVNEKIIVFFMVCHRGHLHPESMTKEQKLDQISNQRFEAIAQQKLRDLRHIASIDIRV